MIYCRLKSPSASLQVTRQTFAVNSGFCELGVQKSFVRTLLFEEARILAQVNGSRAIEQRGIINLTVQYFIVYTALAVPGKW